MSIYRPRHNKIAISEINRMLAERIDALVPDILPAAVREGPEWFVGSVAGEKGRSMAIHRAGANKGVWCDFSDSSSKGDAFELVTRVLFNGDYSRATQWAKSWLGIDTMDPDRIEKVKIEAKKKTEDAEKKSKEDAQRIRKFATSLWMNSEREILNTPVDRYLHRRGINLRDLPKIPRSLRYAPKLEYRHPDGRKTYHPAMIACIVNGSGEFIAIHRTYLRDAGIDAFKADVPNPKLTLGSWRGGIIPLNRGASKKPLSQAPADDKIILCEGIEDALSLAMAMPEYRIAATISVGNIRNAPIPSHIQNIIIAADNDAPDSPAALSLQSAVNSLSMPHRTIRVARVPQGFKDFNERLTNSIPTGVINHE